MKIEPVEGTAHCPACQGAVTMDPSGPLWWCTACRTWWGFCVTASPPAIRLSR